MIKKQRRSIGQDNTEEFDLLGATASVAEASSGLRGCLVRAPPTGIKAETIFERRYRVAFRLNNAIAGDLTALRMLLTEPSPAMRRRWDSG